MPLCFSVCQQLVHRRVLRVFVACTCARLPWTDSRLAPSSRAVGPSGPSGPTCPAGPVDLLTLCRPMVAETQTDVSINAPGARNRGLTKIVVACYHQHHRPHRLSDQISQITVSSQWWSMFTWIGLILTKITAFVPLSL